MRKIPSPPATSLLEGHLRYFTEPRFHATLLEWSRQYGPLFHLRMAHQYMVVVADPAAVPQLMQRGEGYLDKADAMYRMFDEGGVDGIVHNMVSEMTNDTWKAVRKATAQCFSSANLKAHWPVLLGIVEQMLACIEERGAQAFDYHSVARRVTVDFIGEFGFGHSFGGSRSLEGPLEVVQSLDGQVHVMGTVLMDPLWKIKWFFSSRVRRGIKLMQDADLLMKRMYGEWKERGRQGKLPPNSLMSALMNVVDPATGKPLDDHRGRKEAGVLLAAGYETTANSMTFLLLLLLAHPEAMAKLEAELEAAGLLRSPSNPSPRSLEWDDLARLRYLGAVVKEGLRLYPAAPLGSIRWTDREVKISGYSVPRGAMVLVAPYVLDRAAGLPGDGPDTFRPERWLSGAGAQPASEFSLAGGAPAAGERAREPLTFSMGPRDCLGQSLARIELLAFTAALVSRLRVRLAPSPGSPTPPAPEHLLDNSELFVTLHPPGGAVWVQAESR